MNENEANDKCKAAQREGMEFAACIQLFQSEANGLFGADALL